MALRLLQLRHQMNIKVLVVKVPSFAQRALMLEADAAIEILRHMIFAMNGELYARQTAYMGLGYGRLNQGLAHAFTPFFQIDTHA